MGKEIPINIGDKFECISGVYEITKILPKYKVCIKFEDGTEIETYKVNALKGSVWNPMKPVVFEKGFRGIGEHRQNGVKAHEHWYHMMRRAYNPEYKVLHPSYEDVTVCHSWHNYQVFCEWFYKQVGHENRGYNLDKDRLVKGNKIYGPQYCLLIPQELNKLIDSKQVARGGSPVGTSTRPDLNGQYMARYSEKGSGGAEVYLGCFPTKESAFLAYKVAKEKYIKERANFWRDKIDERAYNAVMNYEVLITD